MDDAFKLRARRHQSDYRAKILKLPRYDEHKSVLSEEDARNGQNFYNEYGVFGAVKKRSYTKRLYANMLRSEHIPFNVFVPFRIEKALFCSAVASVIGVNPTDDFHIKIEHAPDPAAEYLDDKTSFDVFCDCKDSRAKKFFVAIEVKYTEHGYMIGDKEKEHCREYNSKSKKWGLYLPGVLEREILKKDRFRQMWRNHLLAESLFRDRKKNYAYYRSIVLYPSGNKYVLKAAAEYKKFLSADRADFFRGIRFEDFFDAIQKHALSSSAKDWLAYLRRRYIPPISSSV